MKNKKMTKFALAFSMILLVVWSLLGTGATIAWFTDATPVIKNSFVIGQIDLDVAYKNDIRDEFIPMDETSELFNKNALYEPNYTQVVYLEITNNGDIDFKYKLSVDLCDYVDSTNVFGMNLHLPQYLCYGVVFGETEEDLTRQLAQFYADRDMMELHRLNQYSEADELPVAPGEVRYAALVVYMPWETGNEANFMTGYSAPQVFLGVTVFAQQADAPMN